MTTIGPKKLMEIDRKLWNELNVTSGGALRQNPKKYGMYKKGVENAVKNSKITEKTYRALENENFHTMNMTLCKLKKYPKSLCK